MPFILFAIFEIAFHLKKKKKDYLTRDYEINLKIMNIMWKLYN